MEHDRDFISKMLSDALTKKKLREERSAARKKAAAAAKEEAFKNKLSKFMSIVCESNNILSSISGAIQRSASKGEMIFSNGENADDYFLDFANLYWCDEIRSKGSIKNWLVSEMSREFSRQGLITGEPIYDEMCIEHQRIDCRSQWFAHRASTTGPISKVPCGSTVIYLNPESAPTWKLYVGEIVTEKPISYYSERFEIAEQIPPSARSRTVYCTRNSYECESKGGCGRNTRVLAFGDGDFVYNYGCISKKVKRMILHWTLPE